MESKKTIFTKGDIILAILLSIFVYTAFWALGIFIGILMGTVVPIAIGMVLPVIVIFAFWKKIKDRKTATMAVSTFLALLIGQFCYQLGKVTGEIPRFALFSLVSVFLGGVVAGSIGYKDFLNFVKRKQGSGLHS